MEAKEFRNILLYMYNRWDQQTCIKLFNDPGQDYKFSLAEHIWNKWVDRRDIGMFLLDLDYKCLQKIINKAIESYK